MGNYCKLPPHDIWEKYREKFKTHKSLHKSYDGKDSVHIEEKFKIGGFSFILFKSIMNVNNIYYLSCRESLYNYQNVYDIMNTRLRENSTACNWLLKNYRKGYGTTNYLGVLTDNKVLEFNNSLIEITNNNEKWPTKTLLKKGLCYRSTFSFLNNNSTLKIANKLKMRVPELNGVPHRKEFKLSKNWLSEIAKDNPNFVGGWFSLKYPKKVKVGGVSHSGHSTSFSVCRDNPKKPTINICNTWGGECSYGKTNPWGPHWDLKKIILGELHIIQYFPNNI